PRTSPGGAPGARCSPGPAGSVRCAWTSGRGTAATAVTAGTVAASGFPLLPGALGDHQRDVVVGHALLGDDHLDHVVPGGELEHDVGHHALEDGAEAAGAGAALERLLGHGAERLGVEGEPHALHLEQLLVLLGQGVLGLD